MPWTGVNPPSVQPDYDPATKYEDPVAYFRQREAVSAERYVQVSEAKVRRGGRDGALSRGQRVRFAATRLQVLELRSTRPVSLQVLRRKLKECYRTEGIDHLSQCRTVRGRNDGVACLPGTCGPHARRPWRHSRAFPSSFLPCSCRRSTWRPSRAWASTRPTLAPTTAPPGPPPSDGPGARPVAVIYFSLSNHSGL